MSELRTQFQLAKRKRDGKMYNEYIRMSNDPTMPKMGIYERLVEKPHAFDPRGHSGADPVKTFSSDT